jgi:hypothetical protein
VAEELADAIDEQVGDFVGSPVAATAIGVPGDTVLVVAFGNGTDRLEIIGQQATTKRAN